MTDNPSVPLWRQAITDSNHPLNKAAWIVFSEKMKPEFADKQLADQKEQVIPFLYEIIDTPALLDDTSLGSGNVPINAVELLGQWKVADAVPRLIKILEDNDWDKTIHDSAITALEEIGAPTVEPLLAFAKSRTDEGDQISLAATLSDIGRRDPNVFAFATSLFEKRKPDDEQDIRFLAESILVCDHEQGIPYLQEKLKHGRYSKKLRQTLERYIEASAKKEFASL